jgi:hypothetical protein
MRPLVLAAALALAPLTAAQAGQDPASRAAEGGPSGRQVFESREPPVAGAVHVKGVAARGVVIHSVESRTVEPRAGGTGQGREATGTTSPGTPRAP